PEDHLEFIRLAEEREGPWSPAIAEHALDLAALQRRSGRQKEALAALEKALQVTRVNKGLFDPSQIPIVRQIIAVHAQLGDFAEARRKEEHLFRVHRTNLCDGGRRSPAAVIEWADWAVNTHLRERALGPAAPYAPRDRHPPGPPVTSPRVQHAKDLSRAALDGLHGAGVEDPRVVATE